MFVGSNVGVENGDSETIGLGVGGTAVGSGVLGAVIAQPARTKAGRSFAYLFSRAR